MQMPPASAIHTPLNLDGASGCIYGAGKLYEHIVACCLDDAASMRSDGGVNKRLSDCPEMMGQRIFFIGTQLAFLIIIATATTLNNLVLALPT
jgi:hypothetical protein